MIERYSTPELTKIWDEESKYISWLKIEILVLEAYAKHNKEITKEDIDKIKKNAKINIERIKEIEKETKHDVIAFTRQISEKLGPEKRWIHYGLTSTDVVDTAQSLRLQEVNKILLKDIKGILSSLKKMAQTHKNTFQIGRTHGIHAEVTTFGYKVALWYDEMKRNLSRFEKTSKQIEVAKISGAVGNYANIPIDVQEYVAKKTGLLSSMISSQTLQRDRHAEYIFTISLIASSLDKFATEIRHLQRTEVNEVAEGFSKKQKGSSAMPHKKNPISSENISGCARYLRSLVIASLENVALWHERDISHSSVERIILPDSTSLLSYMLRRFSNVLENLEVFPKKMNDNIFLTKGVIFSQRAMLLAIEKNNWTREKAYDLIQPIAMQAKSEGKDFKELLIANNLFTNKELKNLYELSYYKNNIDLIFRRLNLNK